MDPVRILAALLTVAIPLVAIGYACRQMRRVYLRHYESGFAGPVTRCTKCYRDVCIGDEICRACGHVTPDGLRARVGRLWKDWPAAPIIARTPEPHEEPTIVFDSDDGELMRLLCDQLGVYGITAKSMLPHQHIYRAIPSWRLVVWSDDAERACELLRHIWPESDLMPSRVAGADVPMLDYASLRRALSTNSDGQFERAVKIANDETRPDGKS